MGLYEKLCELDVMEDLEGTFVVPPPTMGTDGKIQLYKKVDPVIPWVHATNKTERVCGKWIQIYFRNCKLISKCCRCCWKVVWTGETLDQLFRLLKIQEEMGLESKCGVERRPWTGKLGFYQGFWYTPLDGGLDGARELWKKVQDKLSKDKVLGGTSLILKRGCTEFEQWYNPSDAWDEFAERLEWDKIQSLLDPLFHDPVLGVNLKSIQLHTQKKWIEYAWEHRDPTVMKKFPNKYLEQPLKPELLQYQRSVHSGKDYLGWEGSGEVLNVEGATGDRPALVTKF